MSDVPTAGGAEPLRHNEANGATGGVHRIWAADGTAQVRKVLLAPGSRASPAGWAASDDPGHWNYWRREAEVHADRELAGSLRETGLRLPHLDRVDPRPAEVTLWFWNETGRTLDQLDLDDHRRVARGVGRWQAGGASGAPWASRNYLRTYLAAKDVDWSLLDDDAAWSQPLVRRHFPAALRSGWLDLVGHQERLLDVVESSPRGMCHLDLWPGNVIAPEGADVVVLDWAFAGDGAVGEDVGNWVPDSCLDPFWPAARIAELDATVLGAYLEGLRSAGWRGDARRVQLAMRASCVKYAWLPRMLERAGEPEQYAYYQ